jgi:NADH-quinone oxidoreductase subunit M
VTCPDRLTHHKLFYGLVLFLQALLIGFFTARDLVLFTLLYEAMLIPVYIIIVQWGGDHRQMAGLKFLIYMIAGSALLVAAVLGLYFTALSSGVGSFDISLLAKHSELSPHAAWLCGIFFLAFAVKTPLFPFHAWLPDAYCEASTPGTMLLAGLLSKAGVYGFIRVGLELFPNTMQFWSPYLLGLAIAGVFYGAFAAWRQNDYKRLIAFSSFSHVNFILVGIFAWSATAESGAVLQAFNHGVTIVALFLVAGWLEEKVPGFPLRSMNLGGLAQYLPKLCWLTLFFVLASVALPGLNNFVGEIMILFGLFQVHHWAAGILALSVIFSVIYMLRWMQKVYFGTAISTHNSLQDIGWKQIVVSIPLIFLILGVGIYPTPLLDLIKPGIAKIFTIEKREQNK